MGVFASRDFIADKVLFEEDPCPFMYDIHVNMHVPRLSKPLLRRGTDADAFNQGESQKIGNEVHSIVMNTDRDFVNRCWVQHPLCCTNLTTLTIVAIFVFIGPAYSVNPILGTLVTIIGIVALILQIVHIVRSHLRFIAWRENVMGALREYVQNTLGRRYPQVEFTLMYPFELGARKARCSCRKKKTMIGVWFVLRISRNPLIKTPGIVFGSTLGRYAKRASYVVPQPHPNVQVPVQAMQNGPVTVVYRDERKPSLRAGQTYAQSAMVQMSSVSHAEDEGVVYK